MVLIISERKRPLTEYGVEVKVRLVKLNKTQKWLIEEVKKLLPETYLDTSMKSLTLIILRTLKMSTANSPIERTERGEELCLMSFGKTSKQLRSQGT